MGGGDDEPIAFCDAQQYPYAGEEYSAEKVSNLKNALIEALKDATNIRNLKSDDSITVCVFGGSTLPGNSRAHTQMLPGLPGVTGYAGTAMAGQTPFGRVRLVMRGTVLTIRAKKSDVDAFAKGKLNLDEFRKKTSLTTYEEPLNETGTRH